MQPPERLQAPLSAVDSMDGKGSPLASASGKDLASLQLQSRRGSGRNNIRLAASAREASCRRALPRVALLLAAGVGGGLSFLVVPLHHGCPKESRAVNFWWFALDYILCMSYCTIAYLATFNGLYPGAGRGTWVAAWLLIVCYHMGLVFACWRAGAVHSMFVISVGPASGYEITLLTLLAYCVRFWVLPCFRRTLRPRREAGPPWWLARWRAVEAKIRNTQFREDVEVHEDWVRSLPQRPFAGTGTCSMDPEQPTLLRTPGHQLLLCIAFMCCLSACYPSMNFIFAALTGDGATVLNDFAAMAAFNCFAFVIKKVLATIGFVCDCGVSAPDFSGYYAGQFLGSFYYYFYFRAIFEHVDDMKTFAVVQVTHLVLEWVWHVCRATDRYYRFVRRVSERGPGWYQQLTMFLFLSNQPNVSSDDWARFMAVDTALQAFAITVSALAYATGYTVLRYLESARLAFHPFVERMGHDTYHKLMMQLVVQMVTEFLNTCLMELWFRRRLKGRGALSRFPLLFERNTFFVFVLAWCTLHSSNPWIQWMPHELCN